MKDSHLVPDALGYNADGAEVGRQVGLLAGQPQLRRVFDYFAVFAATWNIKQISQ